MNARRASSRPICTVRLAASAASIASHEACVRNWLSANDPWGPTEFATLLLAGLNAVWERARPSLGDSTLAVLFNRALSARCHEPLVAGIGLHVSRQSSV